MRYVQFMDHAPNEFIPEELLGAYLDLWETGVNKFRVDEGPRTDHLMYDIRRSHFRNFAHFASFAHELESEGGGIE